MRVVGAVGIALAAGCLVRTPPITFGGGKSTRQIHHEQMERVTPPVLVANETWTGAISTARIRVWADEDYRGQNVQWKQRFEENLAHANDVLEPMLGLRLVADLRAWDRHAPAGTRLDESLDALVAHDPGTDVFAVVGLVSSLGYSTSFDQLGLAQRPGRHFVMRGYSDIEERKAWDRVLTSLTEDERERMYGALRRHKIVGVFLHELAHCLGVGHTKDEAQLMSASYSTQAASFAERDRVVMLATADARLQRVSTVAATSGTHPSLVIRIDATGATSIAGVELTARGLDEMLQLSFADDPETQVVIRAEANAPRDAITRVGDRAREVGLLNVTVEPR
jgi:biopolymer transport protein ExbD